MEKDKSAFNTNSILIIVFALCGLIWFIYRYDKDQTNTNDYQAKIDSIEAQINSLHNSSDSINVITEKHIKNIQIISKHYDSIKVYVGNLPDSNLVFFIRSELSKFNPDGTPNGK